jgi:glycosyltransferase involved in cell wall biosynthesis
LKETRIESIAAFIASPIDELVNKPNLFPRNRNEICLCTKKVTVITRNFHNASRNESVRKDSIAMVNRTRGMFIYHELVKCDLSRITLVVPCFNEENALEALLASCNKFSNQTGVNFILVDNGSSDSSWEILEKNCGKKIRSVKVSSNSGYGNGVLRGIKECNSDLIGWLHADQTYMFENSQLLSNIPKDLNSFIKGVRINRPKKQLLISSFMSLTCSLVLKTKLKEINAQPSVYPTWFIRRYPNPPADFNFDLFYYYKAKKFGLNEIRIPVVFKEREHGQSKWNHGAGSIAKMAFKVVKAAIKMKGE